MPAGHPPLASYRTPSQARGRALHEVQDRKERSTLLRRYFPLITSLRPPTAF
jgi:hypothetical protein